MTDANEKERAVQVVASDTPPPEQLLERAEREWYRDGGKQHQVWAEIPEEQQPRVDAALSRPNYKGHYWIWLLDDAKDVSTICLFLTHFNGVKWWGIGPPAPQD